MHSVINNTVPPTAPPIISAVLVATIAFSV